MLLLRSEKHETEPTRPPFAGAAVAGAQPATHAEAAETEDAQDAAQTSDRFVHHDESPEAHSPEIGVGELLALDHDQLVGLAVRRDELVAPHHLHCVVADVVVAVPERLDELLAGAAV